MIHITIMYHVRVFEFSKKQTEELDKNFKRDKTIYFTRNIKDFVAKQWLLTTEL